MSLLAAAAALGAGTVQAQDFPTLGGDNARTGRNANPALYGPGIANLVWFWPNGVNRPGAVIRNNTSAATTLRTPPAAWIAPGLDAEAGFPYTPPITTNAVYNLLIGTAAFPAYEYALSTPSALDTHDDPTTAASPANLATFTWTIDPLLDNPTTPSGNYQLYVWLPNGPTGPIGGPFVYPNRYYVYEIIYGTGQRVVDVIDTNVAGQGWIRLGNGGKPTNQVFPYQGQPITIRLYNTEWRDEFNTLLEDNTVQRVVYADAVMAVPDNGYYTAGPVVKQIDTGAGLRTQVVTARNVNSSVFRDGKTSTITTSEVAAFFHDGSGPSGNAPIWKWSPIEVSPNTNTLDNNDPGVTFNNLTWQSSAITNHFGADYRQAVLQNNAGAAEFVTYAPTLEDGDYLVQVYCGGDTAPSTFGTQTEIYVWEGGTLAATIPIDQSVAGWVTLSNQRFRHRGSIGEDLHVLISNYSPNAADAGKFAFADEVRFIGAFNQTINSTPVQVNARIMLNGGTIVDKDVVLVACDDGHLYCLDATGNGNGTTTCYWTYPSILPAGTADPNATGSEDGVGIQAQMPTDAGFGQGAPLVQRIGTTDFAYIAARNGRVYCIDMTGRGDYDKTTGKLGTTSRQWSWPPDYPALTQPALSGFGGSVSFATTSQGDTLFVPALEGRMYALNAVGLANKQTVRRWCYPDLTTPTLGAITTTPTVDFGKVFFGTARASDTVPGQFYALDMNTGAFVWRFEGDPTDADADNFVGGPCTATSAQLGAGNPNMVYCANQNLRVYGIDADTGLLQWKTNELNATVQSPLVFTWMALPNLTGTVVAMPVVMVPTEDGRFDGVFCRTADVNVDGGRLAFEYVAGSDSITASMAVGQNFMYGADMSGNLYAFGNVAAIGGMGPPPGSSSLPPNDIQTQQFKNAKMMLITRQGYQKLRESDPADPTGSTGTLTRAQALAFVNPRTPPAFEWGETAYFLVYDFPFDDAAPAPPQVQFQIAVEGASVRQFGVNAKKFQPTGSTYGEGYAILAFPIQGAGPTSLPPGGANVRFSFTVTSLDANNQPRSQNVPMTNLFPFTVANPLGIYMPDPSTGARGGIGFQFGTDVNPGALERNRNGSPNVPGGTNGALLANTEGVVGNGQSGVGAFWLVDMSMMTLLRGPTRGLENVRMSRPALAWQGGGGAVLKPIDQLLYPGYEDLPINYPNTSIDYPNIGRENLHGTKDPNGTPENLIVSATGVSLVPPILPANYDDSKLLLRQPQPVLCQLDVDVPRFQPANNNQGRYFTTNGGFQLPSGYLGRVNVFVDANGNSILDSISGRREPYRAFTTNLAVAVDERLDVSTPTVDLGSLAEGTGYSPLVPGTNNGTSFSPWDVAAATYPGTAITTNNTDFVNVFKPFRVENLGNVNLLNVRLATGVSGGPAPGPWPIYSNSVDDLGWLDSSVYVYTNFDYLYGLMPQILLQKARVGDRNPTELSTNPVRRLNQNIGVLEAFLFPNGPIGTAAAPRVGVTPPIGFPVGQFSQEMAVIEDSNGNDRLDVDASNNPLEALAKPSFTLKFIVRESRATTGFTKATAPMIDYPQPATSAQNFTFGNLQPSGLRTPAGDLLVAWTSPRTGFNVPLPANATTDPAYRIYFASLDSLTPASATGVSPLRELASSQPNANDRWFRQAGGPFPNLANYDALFQVGAGENIIVGSERFGAPAFPTEGLLDPLGGSPFTHAVMAFVGQAQKQSSAGRTTESRLLTADVAMAADGTVTVNNLLAMPFDPNTQKGRPSVYQVQGGASIFYGAAGTGEGGLFYTVTDGTNFTRPTVVDVGSGFEEVGSPSAQVRTYTGNNGPQNIVELSFIGKLRGRPNSEVFYGRMATKTANVNGTSVNNTPGNPLFLPPRTLEALTPDSEAGTYRALGVVWSTRAQIHVYQSLGGALPIDIEVAGTRTVDRASGIIRFDTKLGGQVYIDPNLGTVRFGTTAPIKSATVFADYTPRFLRISESNVAGHASPTLLWDNRIAGDVSNYSYWFNINSNGSVSNLSTSATPRPARYFYTYTRAAAGAGQAARPYWKSMRIGVKLQHPIATDAGGNVVGLNITGVGPNIPVQVDPVHGLIFFEATEENKVATINYTAVDEAGQPFNVASPEVIPIGIITERTETAVPIDQAVNESGISPFLDPFDWNPRRPGLVWMFFVSTRAGNTDLYFQTMAPRFTPVPNK